MRFELNDMYSKLLFDFWCASFACLLPKVFIKPINSYQANHLRYQIEFSVPNISLLTFNKANASPSMIE